MAISAKIYRTGSASTANTFVVTAGTGDSGKLQIQYNSTDVYNNLSGSTSDVLSGASNTTITIPLDSGNEIPKGVYYFNFVADVGSSDTATTNFQIDEIAPILTPDADVYAPSYRIDDDTVYTVENGTVSAATRTLTLKYPQTSAQPNLSATTSDTTTDLYISTANVWTGALQTTQTYDVTYTIAATTGYVAFTYQESGTGYNTTTIDADNELSDLYTCINNLREQVNTAASKKRSNYADLLSKYTHVCSLAVQFREGVIANSTTDLDEIIAKIKAITNCTGSASTTSSQQSKKLYGIGGNSESIQDIVSDMFTSGTQYGIGVTYNDSTDTISLEGRALFLNVYNDTGSTLSKGKAVYITGYDSASGLPEVSLASNASAASAEAVGLIYADVASATSGRTLVSGWFEEVNTASFTIGDRLYLSTAGTLTATDPAPNSYSQFIATVGEAATAGQLLVQPSAPKSLNVELATATVITTIQSDVTTAEGAITTAEGNITTLQGEVASAQTDISTLQGNMQKVELTISAASAISTLDTASIEVVAKVTGKVVQVHSALLLMTTAPSTSGQVVNFVLQAGVSSGAYAVADALWQTNNVPASVAATAGANSWFSLAPIAPDPVASYGAVSDGIYISNADAVGTYTDWDAAVVKLIVFYSQYTPS